MVIKNPPMMQPRNDRILGALAAQRRLRRGIRPVRANFSANGIPHVTHRPQPAEKTDFLPPFTGESLIPRHHRK
jgi:hypothetical protein